MKVRFFAILLFLSTASASASDTSIPTLNGDLLGLIVFKSDLSDPHSKLESWNDDDDDPCGWVGVNCDSTTRRVIELSLNELGLSGRISPRGLLQLTSLQSLSLSGNNFCGELSSDLTSLENLRTVDFSRNNLSGQIPAAFFRQCQSLRSVSLAANRLSGEIPASIGNCATLASLNLSANWISGSLPRELWSLDGLKVIDLSGNFLVGGIPSGIGRMPNLRALSLKGNRLSGVLPDDIGNCLLLRSIDLGENFLSGALPGAMRRLTMCDFLSLASNEFAGELPDWLGEMKSLQTLDLSGNGFTGPVPDSIRRLRFLNRLNLSENGLTGSLPDSLASCRSLTEVDFSRNSLTGSLPSWLFQMSLSKILVSGNSLSGLFRISSASDQTLLFLDLSANAFSGVIPAEIGRMKLLEAVDLSSNQFNGSIPREIGESVSLKDLNLERNLLTGGIPTQIGNCSSLTSLVLSHNNITGTIPTSLAKLTSLEIIDLSHNRLSGKLPKELSALTQLRYLNISHNIFSGEIPPLLLCKIPLSSLSDNPGLCGPAVNRSCTVVLPKPIVLNPNSSSSSAFASDAARHKKIILSVSALVAIAAAVFIAVGVVIVTVLNLRVRPASSHTASALRISDEYLSGSPVTDTNSGKLVMFAAGDDPDFSAGAHTVLNRDCELGRGGFGTVYRAVLRDGRPVAIKKLTVSSLVKSREDFEGEVRRIGAAKHRNLVGLEGYYWSQSLQLLIYEFVPGGSLFKRLHEARPGSSCLSWRERFDAILGTARGLAHLHRRGVIHYNLKSSNVLVDDASGEAKVADCGQARLLPMLDRYVLSSKIQSALGYMAPEFGCRAVKVTEKCDVYGFGVLVLEVVTGRRPVEYAADDVVVLCDSVRGAVDEGRGEECVDGRLEGKFSADEAVPIVKLGLICTSQVPSNRPEMGEVVKILELIRCPPCSS